MTVAFDFDDSHPHYTPSWLSQRVANLIPNDFTGQFLDPACGAGNLLAAAALSIEGGSQKGNIFYVGIDRSKRAVSACRSALKKLVPDSSIQVIHADFLRLPDTAVPAAQRIILMNPPFKGYGVMAKRDRTHLARTEGLQGRFNLSHGFVSKCIREYQPSLLVAILPSNWFYSDKSLFKAHLQKLGGNWTWESLGNAFEGVAAHVGLFAWRPGAVSQSRVQSQNERPKQRGTIEVRHGVATGADSAFRHLATLGLNAGRIVPSVTGKDVGRSSSSPIWMAKSEREQAKVDGVPRKVLAVLRDRSCVKVGGRGKYAYHESVPKWFLGEPKLLVPEVVSGRLRVELDVSGRSLPLHSVIAIRVQSLEAGESIRQHLTSSHENECFANECPRLAGKSYRLTVGAIRRSIDRWRGAGEE